MSEYRYTLKKFVKDWMLIIAIIAGSSLYIIYHNIPSLHAAGPALEQICTHLQPFLLFTMLFLTFTKIEPHQLKPHKWQAWLLLVQGLSFLALALLVYFIPDIPHRIGIEAFMLCMICPTATACAVVTGKLGGDMAGVVTYTILINLLVAVEIPLLVPLIHPVEGLNFFTAFSRIMAKVFPMLILPCLLAWIIRYLFPKVQEFLIKYAHWSFYIWAFALTLAILMSTRAIIRNENSSRLLADIALASLLSCIIQFWAGKKIGAPRGQKITAGQALGQKNTVFAIWVGYTFMDPITSVCGGFYSICHNCYNTWQLYKTRKAREAAGSVTQVTTNRRRRYV